MCTNLLIYPADVVEVTLDNTMYVFHEDADDAAICVRIIGTVLDRTVDFTFTLVESGTATGMV